MLSFNRFESHHKMSRATNKLTSSGHVNNKNKTFWEIFSSRGGALGKATNACRVFIKELFAGWMKFYTRRDRFGFELLNGWINSSCKCPRLTGDSWNRSDINLDLTMSNFRLKA